MTMWTKPLPELQGKNVNKVLAVLKNVPLRAYMNLIKNYEKIAKENPNVKEFKIISRKGQLFEEPETESIIYMRSKIPLCSDRENLLKSKSLMAADKNSFMFVQNTVEHPDYPT